MNTWSIIVAAEQGDVDELKHWASQARDLNERNSRGMTPLHLAAKEGHLRAVKYLLTQESVNKQEKDSDGRTALHLAAGDGKFEVVQHLCKEGKFDINAKDWRGLTPLHLGKQFTLKVHTHTQISSFKPLNGVMPMLFRIYVTMMRK